LNDQYKLLDAEIQKEAFNMLVDMFQDFVLAFNRTRFVKGKRKLLLFTVLKCEGEVFQEMREYDRAIKAYKSLKNFCDMWELH